MSLAAIQLSAELLRNPDTTGSEDEDDPEAAAAYNRQQEFLAKGASSVQALSQKYEDSSRWERAEDFSTKKQETYIDLNNGHLMVEDEKGNFIDKNQEAEDSGNLEKAKEIEQRVAELLSGAARDLSLNTVYTDAEKAKRNYGVTGETIFGGFESITRITADNKAYIDFEIFKQVLEKGSPETNRNDSDADGLNDPGDDPLPILTRRASETVFNLNSVFENKAQKTQTEAKVSTWDKFWDNLFKEQPAEEAGERKPEGLMGLFGLEAQSSNDAEHHSSLLNVFLPTPTLASAPAAGIGKLRDFDIKPNVAEAQFSGISIKIKEPTVSIPKEASLTTGIELQDTSTPPVVANEGRADVITRGSDDSTVRLAPSLPNAPDQRPTEVPIIIGKKVESQDPIHGTSVLDIFHGPEKFQNDTISAQDQQHLTEKIDIAIVPGVMAQSSPIEASSASSVVEAVDFVQEQDSQVSEIKDGETASETVRLTAEDKNGREDAADNLAAIVEQALAGANVLAEAKTEGIDIIAKPEPTLIDIKEEEISSINKTANKLVTLPAPVAPKHRQQEIIQAEPIKLVLDLEVSKPKAKDTGKAETITPAVDDKKDEVIEVTEEVDEQIEINDPAKPQEVPAKDLLRMELPKEDNSKEHQNIPTSLTELSVPNKTTQKPVERLQREVKILEAMTRKQEKPKVELGRKAASNLNQRRITQITAKAAAAKRAERSKTATEPAQTSSIIQTLLRLKAQEKNYSTIMGENSLRKTAFQVTELRKAINIEELVKTRPTYRQNRKMLETTTTRKSFAANPQTTSTYNDQTDQQAISIKVAA